MKIIMKAEVNKMVQTPLSITQYKSTAQQNTAFEMNIKWSIKHMTLMGGQLH